MVNGLAIAGQTLSPVKYKILIKVLTQGNIRSCAEVRYEFLRTTRRRKQNYLEIKYLYSY